LLEVAAEEIARLCLNDTRVQKVRISLEKLDVYKNAKSVGIEIWRSRIWWISDNQVFEEFALGLAA